ncbi:MAG: c-type cytochrome, partial [Planctomycetales bacterium]|nr:c-type cytochrome [Planctomycetales bacterium]
MRRCFVARAPWLALFVVCTTVCAQVKAAPHVPAYERFHRDASSDQVAAGMLLVGELNCAACHAAGDSARAALDSKQSPVLDDVAQRVNPAYTAKFLANPQAIKPGATMPSVLHGLSGAEAAQQAERLAHFLASLAPDGPPAGMAPIGGRARGEALYHTVGCAACHGSRKEGAAPLAHDKPLGDLEAKYTLLSLAAFLQDPLHARPSGRMPGLNLSGLESRDLAAFLLPSIPEKSGLAYKYYEGSWNNLPDFETLEPKAFGGTDKIDIGLRKRDDQFAFRFEGALGVDAEGEYTFWLKSDDGSRLTIDGKVVVDNDGVHPPQEKSGKAKLEKGTHLIVVDFFEQAGGEEITADFAGPGLGRRRLDTAIVATQPETDVPQARFVVDAEKAKAGRALFASAGCASCHNLRESKDAQPIASTLVAPALAQLKANAGCLSAQPGAKAMKYDLTEGQRQAIAAALAALGKPQQPSPQQVVHATMSRLNCYACHVRGGVGGAADATLALFQGTQPEMGDEGRLPPPLDGVGDKLNNEWLKQIFAEGAKDRPYMLARMPKFGAAAGPLPAALAAVDVRPALPKVDLPATEAKLAGWRMVGDRGFSCIKCHTFRRFPATGVQSMDMTIMAKRLRQDWFRRYVDNPQSFRQGTRMPDAWPGEDDKSLLDDVLDGRKQTQIQAVWNYLSDGPRARTPAGVVTGSLELIPTFEPILYRNFIEGAGPRAIGVGYPEQLSLAFDANDLRLALIWQGAFIDASKHWVNRGSGFQGPAGQKVLQLPAGTTFAALADGDATWPGAPAKEQGFQFRGYRLSKEGRPTFRYSLGTTQVEDFPSVVV